MSQGFRHVAAALAAAAAVAVAPDGASARQGFGENILSFDHYVDHVSTIPGLEGRPIKLHVRERVLEGIHRTRAALAGTGKAVLLVHGATSPASVVFDLQYRDYSWSAYLAQAGFDVFSLELHGYGASSHLEMDDPCNLSPAQQALLIPDTIPAPCSPSYPFRLNTAQSEWDEIDTVVDFIRERAGVEKVSIGGWSAGGPRVGGYTVQHPEKIDKVLLYAPTYNRNGAANPPATLPQPGFSFTIATYQSVITNDWNADIANAPFPCENTVEPGVQDIIWAEFMALDPLGASWGPGVARVPQRTNWGWNAAAVASITAPTLIIVGVNDSLIGSDRLLYEDLNAGGNKVMLEVACGTHFMVWESQRHVFHEASKNWFLHGSIKGVKQGKFYVDEAGKYHRQ